MKYTIYYSYGPYDDSQTEIVLELSQNVQFTKIDETGRIDQPGNHPHIVLLHTENLRDVEELLRIPVARRFNIGEYVLIRINRCIPPKDLLLSEDAFSTRATQVLRGFVIAAYSREGALHRLYKISHVSPFDFAYTQLNLHTFYEESLDIATLSSEHSTVLCPTIGECIGSHSLAHDTCGGFDDVFNNKFHIILTKYGLNEK